MLLRGLRWRLGASLLTVLTATVAVATAVLGPMYQHTAGDSVLRSTVAAAAIQDRGLTLAPRASSPPSLRAMQRATGLVRDTVGAHRLDPVITTVVAGARPAHEAYPYHESELLARTGICRSLTIVRGRCELGRDDVVMTQAGTHGLRVAVGGRLAVVVAGLDRPLELTVTGIARDPDPNLPYWWGDGDEFFPLESRAPTPPLVAFHGRIPTKLTDSLIVSQATALHVPAKALPTVIEQIPVRRDAVDLGDESAVRRAVARDAQTLAGRQINFSTQLPEFLSDADHQRHVMATIIAIAATQLVLLAIWVLASLLVRSSDARRSEVRIARLRGFPPAGMLWVTAAEPALLCLIGAVLGVALAWVAMLVSRARLFVPGSAIRFDVWTFAALALTLAAIAGALGIGTVRLLRSADLAQGSSPTSRASSIAGTVVDVVLVVLAVVALVALSTTGALSGHTNPIASAAPGLIALGAAVLAVHIMLAACRLGIRLTENSERVGPFLALRQIVRRPGVLRQARVLVIALCLACFATAAWSVARGNRATAAAFQIGTHAVVTVAPTGAAGLQSAVERADPRGRFAMAAVQLRTSSTTLLAVDASRLTVAASWPRPISGPSLRTIAHRLDPPTAPAVGLTGGPVRLVVRTTATGPALARLRDLSLGLWVSSPSGGTTIADLGRLRDGRGRVTYHGNLSGLCGANCRLAGIGIVPIAGRPVAQAGSVTLTVDGLSSTDASGTLVARRADMFGGGWRSDTPGVRDLRLAGRGLTLHITAAALGDAANESGSLTPPMALPADHPTVLPGVATTQLEAVNASANGPLNTEGLDGGQVSVAPAARASALPRIGADGLMVDLALLSRIQVQPTDPDVVDQVWLGPAAPADALARLRDAGLRITGVARASTVFSQLQGTGPALADDFLLVATIAALLVAMASTLGALGATARERATELASLEVAGVPRATLVRSLGVESVVLLLTALCGVGAGVLAAALAVPSLPELAHEQLAPLRYALPAGVIVGVALAVIAAIALAAAIIDAALVRRMSPGLLRTAPDDISG